MSRIKVKSVKKRDFHPTTPLDGEKAEMRSMPAAEKRQSALRGQKRPEHYPGASPQPGF